jgi:hypothetical protein
MDAKNLFDKEYVAACFDFGCQLWRAAPVVGVRRYRW